MIVTCPNCETRYNLPDEKIPAGGAKVKCSKCGQVFKAELPPETPEEEVEALLDEESQGGDTQAGEDFDETFEDVAAGVDEEGVEEESADEEPVAEEPAEDFEEEVAAGEDDLGDDLFDDLDDDEGETVDFDEGPDDELPDTDDLFDEAEEELPEPDEGATPSEPEGDDLFDDLGGEDEAGEDDLFADDEDEGDESGLFDEDEEEDEGGLFDEADEEGEADDEGEEDVFGGEDSLSLDEDEGKGSRKPLGCLIALAVVALVLGGAIYFQVWTYMGINLGDTLKNVPFVGQMFMEETGGGDEVAPGESPAERVRKIELKNVKQYYVANEKAGNLFVVEGKAINKFAKPKERIKVEVILYDDTNNVLTSQSFLCGNVLSQFQLQVQSEKEIKDGLASEVGILSNNTFIRPGASTPFMAVFFQPPSGVKEFMVKVVDVGDPE